MVQRFLGKKPFNRYVRPVRHTRSLDKIDMEKVVTETENNDNKDVVDMKEERLTKVEALVNAQAPKRKVKVEKKDKGLIERTENSTILLTEDNKMMLND